MSSIAVTWQERLSRAATIASADAVAVVAMGDDSPHVAATLSPLQPSDWPERLGAGLIRRVLKDGDPIAVDLSGEVADQAGSFQSALLIPARMDPPLVVVLLRRSSAFDPEEIARYAPIGALLIELHEETRSRVRARTALEHMDERLRVHDDVRPALAGAQNSASLLEEATRAIAERFQADAASVMLLEADGELHVRGAFGLPPDVVRSAHRRMGEGIAGWVAERGEPVILRGPIDDWRFTGVDPDARAALSVPLRLRGETIGVLNVKRPRATDLFDETHLRILQSIAADLAASLRHVETIERLEDDRRQAVTLAEIARMARAGDRRTAAALACESFGFTGIGVLGPGGIDVLHETKQGALEGPDVARLDTATGTVLLATEGPGPGDAIREWIGELLAPAGENDGPGLARGTTRPIRVFLAEPHAMVREGLRSILERQEDIAVSGSAATFGEAAALLPEARPDVILANLQLLEPELGIARLHELGRGAAIVAVGPESVPGQISTLLGQGVRGYLPRHATPDEIRSAVRAAAGGLVALHPSAASALALGSEPASAGWEGAPPEWRPRPEPSMRPGRAAPAAAGGSPAAGLPAPGAGAPQTEPLTPRETEYLRYIADGLTNKEIAKAMVLAEDTVKKGVQGLIAKLGAADRTHAVAIAIRGGLIR